MEKVYVVKGTEKQIEEMDKLLGYIELLGILGHSTTFSVFIDGDGSSRIKTSDIYGEKIYQKDKIKNIIDSYYEVKQPFCFD